MSNKPRRDITLGEMQDECNRAKWLCTECDIKFVCPTNLHKAPTALDLTDPPRFTEAQMALLKVLYASGVVKIVFGATNDLLRCLDAEFNMAAGLFWEKIGLPREEIDLAELLGKDGAET